MRLTIKIMAIIFAVILCFVFLLSSILYVAFNQNIYKRIQIKQDIAAYNRMPQECLDEITKGLIDYMKGERPDFVFYSDYNDNNDELFNNREKKHMEDVRALIELSYSVIVVAISILAFILILGLFMDRGLMRDLFIKIVVITMIIVVLLLMMLIFYMIADFYNVWVFLHELVFTNDLYFLDPYTDLLINIMPLDFFVSICLNVGLYFGLLFLSLFVMIFTTKLMKKVVKKWIN